MTLKDDLQAARQRYERASREAQVAKLAFIDAEFSLKEAMLDMPKGTTIIGALLILHREGPVEIAHTYQACEKAKIATDMELERADKDHKALRSMCDRTTAEVYQLIEDAKLQRSRI